MFWWKWVLHPASRAYHLGPKSISKIIGCGVVILVRKWCWCFVKPHFFFRATAFFFYDNRQLDKNKNKWTIILSPPLPLFLSFLFSSEAACQVTASLIRFSNQAWIKVLKRCFVLYSTNIYSKYCARELKNPNKIQLCIPMKQLLKMIKVHLLTWKEGHNKKYICR